MCSRPSPKSPSTCSAPSSSPCFCATRTRAPWRFACKRAPSTHLVRRDDLRGRGSAHRCLAARWHVALRPGREFAGAGGRPLRVQDVTVGALVITKLFDHKGKLDEEDRELARSARGARRLGAVRLARVFAGCAQAAHPRRADQAGQEGLDPTGERPQARTS
jgi:hypothetical protein